MNFRFLIFQKAKDVTRMPVDNKCFIHRDYCTVPWFENKTNMNDTGKKQTKHELSLVSFCWKEWKVITTVVPMNENDILWSTSIGLVNFAKFVSLIVFIVCHLSCYVSIYVCEFAMFPIFSLALILYHHRRNKSALDFWFKNKQKHLIFLASA